jgi:hypothetical protein
MNKNSVGGSFLIGGALCAIYSITVINSRLAQSSEAFRHTNTLGISVIAVGLLLALAGLYLLAPSSAHLESAGPAPTAHPTRLLARIVFFTFLLIFVASRVLVILIMTRKMPDLFLHMGGTHVHHLNYGIFLLSAIGALLLFTSPSQGQKQWIACAYGFAMALTFDEFGMWLHLGGGYWQRASYDGVVVIAAILGLISFAPPWRRLGSRHYVAAGVTLAAVGIFCWLSLASLNFVDKRMGPRLRAMEESGPQ